MATLAEIEGMARDTVAGFPEPFRHSSRDVVLRVEDWPTSEMLRDLEIDDPLELTGLYQGIPLTEKSLTAPSPYPDVVWLFRRPILDEWRARGNVSLAELVAHVTVHEFAHHFGWSDADIARIDPWWE